MAIEVSAEVLRAEDIAVAVKLEMSIAQWQVLLAHLKWDGPSNALRDCLTAAINQIDKQVRLTTEDIR